MISLTLWTSSTNQMENLAQFEEIVQNRVAVDADETKVRDQGQHRAVEEPEFFFSDPFGQKNFRPDPL